MDKDIFALVTKEQDRQRLFEDLARSQGEILCKGMSDSLCKFQARIYHGKSKMLECLSDSSTPLINGEEYLGYFFIGGEKYYFKGRAVIVQDRLHISVPKELFHLQRRQNYRVRVPKSVQAFFNIVEVNSKPQTISGQIADLSSQGCRVSYSLDKPILRLNDYVTGHLVVGKKAPIELQGQVRHIKVDEENTKLQTFGIEFISLSSILENKLFAITMEIHKLLFKADV